eukprot:10708548-Ditylum_brightwellii.AAC.1
MTREDSYFIQLKDELFGKDWLHSYATKILNAKYDFTDVIDVDPHKKFHIDIDLDATPVYSRPYNIPHTHLSTFKRELEYSVKIGVLAPQNESEWASPTFIVPKKDGRI